MSKIHTTLHKKGDSSVDVYPNIESENIPSGAITQDKMANGSIGTNQILANAITSAKISSNAITSGKLATSSVTTDKINDGAVTTSKITNSSITNEKIADGSISNAKIQDNAITYNKLSSDITTLFDKINRTYNLFFGVGTTFPKYFGNTTLSSLWNNYTNEEINEALDFDKLQGEYSNTDLDIIALIIDGLYTSNDINGDYESVGYGDIEFIIRKTSLTNYQIYYYENNVAQFKMEFDSSTHTIIDHTNTKILHLTLKKAINFDVM